MGPACPLRHVVEAHAGPHRGRALLRPLGPGLTRVAVEHRGWESLTEEQLGEDCAAPGGYASGAYSRGWALVLERFGAHQGEDTA